MTFSSICFLEEIWEEMTRKYYISRHTTNCVSVILFLTAFTIPGLVLGLCKLSWSILFVLIWTANLHHKSKFYNIKCYFENHYMFETFSKSWFQQNRCTWLCLQICFIFKISVFVGWRLTKRKISFWGHLISAFFAGFKISFKLFYVFCFL